MASLLRAAEMRAVEKAAIRAGEATGLDLMARAGRGVVEAMLAWRPRLAGTPGRVAVLCGPGNNGGDGFVIARLLKARGWAVEVFLHGCDPAAIDRLPADAATNARRWREMGEILPLCPGAMPSAHDICIDALFGTGLTRDLAPEVVAIIRAVNARRPASGALVSVDIATGLCSDSGRARPVSFLADLTVTFHRARPGHYLASGPEASGLVAIADIGLGAREGEAPIGAITVNAPRLLSPEPALDKGRGAHKYSHGHALILSGGVGKGGAARLAARGALRIGAGLVTVGCPPAALQENAAALDAIMLTPLGDAAALTAFLPARKVGAVCLGPGFGHGARLRAFVEAVLGGARARPTGIVLDADALGEYADDPATLFAMLHPNCVLTPHQGEFGRLFPDILARLTAPAGKGPAFSKVDATRAAAARAGSIVVFKGPDTVIADPAGRTAIGAAAYGRAAPWLATAGSGDVLAGFIGGLMARGFEAFDAAEAAVWLHVECARRFGPGLIAEDLPEQLPAVLRDLKP